MARPQGEASAEGYAFRLVLSKGRSKADLYCLLELIDIEMQRLTTDVATHPRTQINLLLLRTSHYTWTSKEPVELSECLVGSR
jgi:hypothetical protein